MALLLNKLNYIYGENTSFARHALTDIELEIKDKDFIAIIGRTGSGKSTLIQMMNALLKPTSGEIYYNGLNIWDEDFDRRALRGKIGMVFQYPEHQLFETSVIKDVCFGPKNIGMSPSETEENAYAALKKVGIDEELMGCSPFELSGGQKRRTAIAGILAMKPEMIILDEPTAGLDPAGRTDILNMLRDLNESGMTIVLVSHSMEDVAKYAKRAVVMSDSKIVADAETREIFARKEMIESAGLCLPEMAQLYFKLKDRGIELERVPLDDDEAFEMIREWKERND